MVEARGRPGAEWKGIKCKGEMTTASQKWEWDEGRGGIVGVNTLHTSLSKDLQGIEVQEEAIQPIMPTPHQYQI